MNDSKQFEDNGAPMDPSRRPHTLKARIKHAMASNECSTQVNSVLTAASALASLGSETSPDPSNHSVQSRSNGQHNVGSDAAPGVQSAPVISGSRMERHDVGRPAMPSRVDHPAMPPRIDHDVPMTFPQKLMEVLSNHEISDIITWLPHGRGFIILQKRKFASEVMPLYFKHSKFTSFTRKLNRWGFTRITRGPETGAYYHKFFQRDNHLLCMQMHCQSSKSGSDMSPGLSPQMPSPNVMNAMSSLRIDESGIPSPPFSHPQDGNARYPGNVGPYGQNMPSSQLSAARDLSFMQRASQGNMAHNRSALERVLMRQRELLREEQRVRMMQDQNSVHHQQSNEFVDSRRQQLGGGGLMDSLQTNRINNSPSFGGLNMTSSRQHPYVIQAALNALQSCNDRAYLTMLMTREHNKSESASRDAAAISSSEIQNRVHAAMQAQMRQLEEYNRRSIIASKTSNESQVVSQNEVAQLHKEIRQQNSNVPTPGRHYNSSASSKYPPGVRRASAA